MDTPDPLSADAHYLDLARAWVKGLADKPGNFYGPIRGPIGLSDIADLIKSERERSTLRATSLPSVGEAVAWPGTVPACPACASTSDVEWATCSSDDDVCPLKIASIRKCPTT